MSESKALTAAQFREKYRCEATEEREAAFNDGASAAWLGATAVLLVGVATFKDGIEPKDAIAYTSAGLCLAMALSLKKSRKEHKANAEELDKSKEIKKVLDEPKA